MDHPIFVELVNSIIHQFTDFDPEIVNVDALKKKLRTFFHKKFNENICWLREHVNKNEDIYRAGVPWCFHILFGMNQSSLEMIDDSGDKFELYVQTVVLALKKFVELDKDLEQVEQDDWELRVGPEEFVEGSRFVLSFKPDKEIKKITKLKYPITRYGEAFKTMTFSKPVTEWKALELLCQSLKKPMTEKWYNKIILQVKEFLAEQYDQHDEQLEQFKEDWPFNPENQRDNLLGGLVFIEGITEEDGTFIVEMGS
jgi:hypothetical protein